MLEKIKALFGAGLSKEEHDCIKPIAAQQNIKTLQWVSLLTAVLMLVLVSATLFPLFSLLSVNRLVYIVTGILSAAIYCASLFLLPKRPFLTKPLFYLFLSIIVAFGVYVGVVTNTSERGSTICVLLLVIPLLIIDKPWRIFVFLSLSALFFCAASYYFKSYALFAADFVNCICILVIGTAVNFAQQGMKYRRLNDRYIIDQNNVQLINSQKSKLEESRISIMLSQIGPHFLYNSLSAISYLCEKDPLAAQAAIGAFSDYLRCNMDSLKLTAPVSFEKELEHTETYLSLEKMRFDDDLNIVYDIRASGFLIPSLTLQPLAENAVRYGIFNKKGGGTVTIATREYDDRFEVIVSDDGAGCDPYAAREDGRSHIGIDNVRSRLASMVGGTLDIQSTKGIGTTAVIKLPKYPNTVLTQQNSAGL